MSRGLNIVALSGHLAQDPELKYTPAGAAVATFTICVDDAPVNGGEPYTNFIDCVAWRQQAEFAANYLAKGRRVEAEGRLRTRKYKEQGTNRNRKVTEVVITNLSPTDRPAGSEEPADYEAGADHLQEESAAA